PAPEQAANVFGVIRDAEVPSDELGNPSGRPQLIGEAVSGCSLQKKLFQFDQLRVAEAAFATGRGLGGEAVRPARQPAPAVQGGGPDAEDASHHDRSFTLLKQRHRTASAPFQFSGCPFRPHTSILRFQAASCVFRKAGRSSAVVDELQSYYEAEI